MSHCGDPNTCTVATRDSKLRCGCECLECRKNRERAPLSIGDGEELNCPICNARVRASRSYQPRHLGAANEFELVVRVVVGPDHLKWCRFHSDRSVL